MAWIPRENFANNTAKKGSQNKGDSVPKQSTESEFLSVGGIAKNPSSFFLFCWRLHCCAVIEGEKRPPPPPSPPLPPLPSFLRFANSIRRPFKTASRPFPLVRASPPPPPPPPAAAAFPSLCACVGEEEEDYSAKGDSVSQACREWETDRD